MNSRLLWGLLMTILAIRLVTMALYPVMDTTEARYTEISRLMLISGQWLVPQFSEGVPFWGKPPLFAWLTAGSFKLFGVSEFAGRLPHFLLGMATLWLIAQAGRHELSSDRKLLALVILSSTPLFFISAGTVMTESGLLFSTTLSMTAFWLCVIRGQRAWGMIFFAGLGLGLLAKGPIAVVLTFLPLMLWVLSGRRWQTLTVLPWLRGSLLALLIALPWYVTAEYQSPGFLEYFLVGEHFLRFIEPGWSGDLYGNAHREVPGMIWLLWFQATAAWGAIMVFALGIGLVAQVRNRSYSRPRISAWQSYLACWVLAPLLFFTFSGNILWTYVISGIPAFGLLMATRTGGEEHS